MTNIEIPQGKRTKLYRFFEILPAALSYGMIILLIILSFSLPIAAAIVVLFVVISVLVRSLGIAIRTFQGSELLKKGQKQNWQALLEDLENPSEELIRHKKWLNSRKFMQHEHVLNLDRLAKMPDKYPRVQDIRNAVIIALYNESYDVIKPTLDNLLKSDYDAKKLIVVIAYEARGGQAARETINAVKHDFNGKFADLLTIEHPDNIAGEIMGKGGNITYAGRELQKYLDRKKIAYENVIVTTLDCDNKPHPGYFSYLTYCWITTPDRQQVSFQPVCTFTNNIWYVPAPMRVIATGNSFWNIISSLRPHTLRNFASHAQGMSALVAMNFWSVRTIVEDGHQYWRSYFHFDGNYRVIPLYINISQDAVLSDTYKKTLKAQFVQLRRWAYGCSDVAYVAKNLIRKDTTIKFLPGWSRFLRLLEGHVSLAYSAIIITVGAWIPLFLNGDSYKTITVHLLPQTVGLIQQIAMIGIIISIFFSFKILPPRPEIYKKHRNVIMVLQWILMPITAVVYSALSAFYSQTRLALGKYMEKFDVTQKKQK